MVSVLNKDFGLQIYNGCDLLHWGDSISGTIALSEHLEIEIDIGEAGDG